MESSNKLLHYLFEGIGIKSSIRDSAVLRMGIVAVLGLILLVPVSFVSQLIQDREKPRDGTLREVTEKWGAKQTVTGPILSIPVKRTVKTRNDIVRTSIEFAHFLPDKLTLQIRLSPVIRYRGIYRVALYNAQMAVEADFPTPPVEENMAANHDAVKDASVEVEIMWKDSFLTFGISDLKGLKGISGMTADQQPLVSEPGLRTRDLVQTGFTFRMPLSANQDPGRLTFEMSVNGSEDINIVPLGKETKMDARSDWASPSFIGDFLPEKREITDSSFAASWNVLHLNRNLPQFWIGTQSQLQASSFGVKLLLPVDEYQKNMRAVKYAVMFIGLTFLAFFVIDVLSRSPFHPIHYTLVGFALILFFVLLLSISEHVPFNTAYLIASLPVILLISMYTRGITGRWGLTAVVTGILTILYGLLFILLQLEDYALLLGSVSLFASLAAVMYLTRRIDWFGLGKQRGSEVVCSREISL
jgi:inner membrane protein